MMKRKIAIMTLCALFAISGTVPVYADAVTNFEDWTPDGNGGYVNSAGQSGSDGSSDVNVSDGGSGKSESSSSSSESGIVINTETEKQTSVTIETTVTDNNSEIIKDITNGELVPTVEQQPGTGGGSGNTTNDSGGSGGDSYPGGEEIGNPRFPEPSVNNPSNPSAGKGDTDKQNGENQQESNPSNFPECPDPPSNEYNLEEADAWGMVPAEKIENVYIDEKGKWIISFRYENGQMSQMTFDTADDVIFILTGVKDETGNTKRKEYQFKRSDELEEWIFKHYLWRAVNVTFKTSSYYGAGKIVAKTTRSSAVFTLGEAGKYRVLATPYHDVRHYHIYEWEDDDGTHTEEITDYWEYDRTKSPDVYSVVVPIITDGGKEIKVCINGGCDCETDLNAVCDEANEPQYDIENRVELEK